MLKALIVFSTRKGYTEGIAKEIAAGIRLEGVEAKMVNVINIKKAEDLEGYDAYLFGSATYGGQMMRGMETMLFMADNLDLEGKVGGSFGAFGWSGEAPGRIFDTMKNIFNMDMVKEPLRIKNIFKKGDKEIAQEYGREIGKKLKKEI
ncbi:MAG: FprA family A-type flavoprotein [Deltaproteobacteria bacterium]|nr:FprA family A-type flavoprotein [Deltaproteobacteria bacterium]